MTSNTYRRLQLKSTQLSRIVVLMAMTGLAACGGGGGGGGGGTEVAPGPAPIPAPAPSTDPKAVAGFWTTRVDAQTTASAIFLPEGQAWTVLQNTSVPTSGTTATLTTTTLARGSITVSDNALAVTGPSYTFSNPALVGTYALSGTFVPKTSISVSAQTSGATPTPALTWAYNAAFEIPARLSDAVGRWNTSFAQGAIKVTLDFTALGAITGTSTTGCTYTGSVVPHPAGIAVFNLTLNEACLNQASRSYSGIATVNAAGTSLSAAYTTSDGALAGLLVGTR